MRIHHIMIVYCLSILGLLFLSQTSQAQNDRIMTHTATATTDITTVAPRTPLATKYYDAGGPFITLPLMCPGNIRLKEGLSWRGITVGKSRLSDLEELYGMVATRVVPDYAGSFAPIYRVTLTGRASIERQLAVNVEACLVDWKIAALSITPTNDIELSDLVETWVARYGPPKIVAWSTGGSWRYRDLVWPEIGLALHVDLGDATLRLAYVTDIVFFPSMQNDNDLSNWPYSQLRKDAPTTPNEGYPEELNPFDFPSMMATDAFESVSTVTP